jgi:hypothetical protein
MSKDYFSQAEQTQWLFLNALAAELNQTIETYAKSKHCNKNILRLLRMAYTWTMKASEAWLATVGAKEHSKLVDRLTWFVVSMIPARDVVAKVRKRQEQERLMREQIAKDNPDHINTIAEFAMVRVCTACDGCIKSDCQLYPALEALGIEPYGEYDTCKYAYVEPKGVA